MNKNSKGKKYTTNNINTKSDNIKSDNIKSDKERKIISVEGYECIGPCYPPNTYYYNPLDLSLISTPFASCPIKPVDVIGLDSKIHKKKFDRCNDEDINKGKLYFDIFSDYIQIATTSDNFLSEIYNLNNISDIVHFLSNSIDTLPIYSQRRILGAIYDVYYKYIEFPKLLFCKKLLIVLKNIYKLIDLDENSIQTKLSNSELSNSKDLYKLFY